MKWTLADLSSKAVEESVDEAQTVLATLSIDAVNGYEKDAIENPTATISSLEQKRTIDQMAEKQKLSSQATKVSKRKRIPHAKLRN